MLFWQKQNVGYEMNKKYTMLTQEIRNKVQRLWNMFWSRGITNPITAIEQISYLLFIRRLEEVDEYDNVTNVNLNSATL